MCRTFLPLTLSTLYCEAYRQLAAPEMNGPAQDTHGGYLPRKNAFGQTCGQVSTVSLQTRHATRPAQGGSQQRWLQERQRERTPHCGVGNANDMDIPVPSTMTSYSFAISSMFASASGSGVGNMAVRVQHCLGSRRVSRGKRCGRAVLWCSKGKSRQVKSIIGESVCFG